MASPEEPLEDSPMRSLAGDDGARAPVGHKEPAATLVKEESEIKLVSEPTLIESDSVSSSGSPRSGAGGTPALQGLDDATTVDKVATTTENCAQDTTTSASEETAADLESGAAAPPLPPQPPEDDGSARLKEVLNHLTGPKLKVWLILAATLFAIFLFRTICPALGHASTAIGNYGLSEFLYSVQSGRRDENYAGLGAAYERRGDFANAERLYGKSAPHFGGRKSDYFALTMGAILDKQKKYAEADTYYASIETRTNKTLQYTKSRQRPFSIGNRETDFAQGKARVIALPRLLRLIGQIPPDVRARHFAWAQPYWNRMEQGKSSPAIAEVVQIDLRPIFSDLRSDMNSRKRPPAKGLQSPPLSSEALSANQQGKALGEAGRNNEAILCFDQVIKEEPLRAIGYVNKALTQRKTGDNIAALRTLDQGVARAPGDAELYLLRGKTLADLKKHKEAWADFDTGYALDPEMAYLYDPGKTITGAKLAEYLSTIGKQDALKHPFTAKLAKEFFPEKGSNLLLKSDVSGEKLGRKLYPASPQDLVREHYFIMDHKDFCAMEALSKQVKAESSTDSPRKNQ